MKRWLLVASDFITTGGMDIANLRLAEWLARRGDHVELLGHRVDASLTVRPNVRHHRVIRPLGSNLLAQPLLNTLGQRAAREVRRAGGRVIVNGGNCLFDDVNWVHYVHRAYRPELKGSVARKLHRAVAQQMGLTLEALALRRARLVFANSRRTAEDLERLIGVDPARIRVVYCGIDGTRFKPPEAATRAAVRAELGLREGEPAFIFIGALTDRRKGFDTAFQAWREVSARAGWDGRLFVVGSGAEVPAWRKRLAEAGLSDQVTFLGHRGDVPRLLTGMDGLLAPTRYEPFGLAVLEALCVGVPALVSATAGVAERYSPELHGLLLDDCEDAHELARKLEALRDALPAYREKVRRLSESLRQHGWEEMSAQMIEAIEA